MYFKRLISVVLIAQGLIGCELRNSNSSIESKLLIETPIGSTRESVLQFIITNNYRHYINKHDSGKVSGEFIRAEIGSYGLLFQTNVTAFWEFDNTNALQRIVIWKTTDSP